MHTPQTCQPPIHHNNQRCQPHFQQHTTHKRHPHMDIYSILKSEKHIQNNYNTHSYAYPSTSNMDPMDILGNAYPNDNSSIPPKAQLQIQTNNQQTAKPHTSLRRKTAKNKPPSNSKHPFQGRRKKAENQNRPIRKKIRHENQTSKQHRQHNQKYKSQRKTKRRIKFQITMFYKQTKTDVHVYTEK